MSLEIKGKLIQRLSQEGGTSKAGKQWTKDAFVLQLESGNYPKQLKIDVFNNNEMSQFINDTDLETPLLCYINLDSKEWNGKWFHNVTLWKAEVMREGNQEVNMHSAPPPPDDSGDLPF